MSEYLCLYSCGGVFMSVLRDVFTSSAAKKLVAGSLAAVAMVGASAAFAEAGGRHGRSNYYAQQRAYIQQRVVDHVIYRAERAYSERENERLMARQAEINRQNQIEYQQHRAWEAQQHADQRNADQFINCVNNPQTGPVTQGKMDACEEVVTRAAQIQAGQYLPPRR